MSVALFALGGTIAMAGTSADTRSGRPSGTSSGGPSPGHVVTRLTGAELTAAVPGLDELEVTLEVRDAHAVPSAGLTFSQVLRVVEAASRAVESGAVGVVVTQGTDTLEETAYLVDLVWPHAAPFVLTGAMRNPTLAGADGPANVLAAVRVAASAPARDLGALVVLNDEIHAARWARKTHSTSTATFASPNAGPLGQVIEGEVRVLTRPPRRETLPALPEVPERPERPALPTLPTAPALDAARVALHTVSFDDDGGLLGRLTDTDAYQGLVVAGFGVGHVPPGLAPVLGGLAGHMPVVLTSRSGSGSVLRSTYGSVGSETDLQRRGLINGGLLDPYKARVLLRLLLASGADHGEVAAAFARHG